MAIIRFRPDYDLYRIERDINRVFNMLNRNTTEEPGNAVWSPVTDIVETKNTFELVTDLPGVRPDAVKINVEDGKLVVNGERTAPETSDKTTLHRQERLYGKFYRSFDLPRTINTDGIRAEFNNGQLTITIPKQEQAVSREIEINVK